MTPGAQFPRAERAEELVAAVVDASVLKEVAEIRSEHAAGDPGRARRRTSVAPGNARYGASLGLRLGCQKREDRYGELEMRLRRGIIRIQDAGGWSRKR